MAQYIDKSVVKEEIEKLDNFWHLSKSASGQAFIESLSSFLTIKAKEVDLEKEIKDYFNNQPMITRSKGVDYQLIPSGEEIAKHFFELGLNEQKEK